MAAQGFIQAFDEQAGLHPARTVLVAGNTRLTYADLQAQSRRAATALSERGCGKGDVLAIALPASAEWIIAMMAILRCGAAYVPIDQGLPLQRREWIMRYCDAKAVIAEAEGRITGSPVWSVKELLAASASATALPYPASGALAYLIFTSGTSGQPKGVSISHANLAAYLSAARDTYFRDEALHNFGLISSPAYDLAVTAIHLPLSAGHQVSIFALGNNILNMAAALSDTTLTALKCTPSHLSLIRSEDCTARLSLMILGGEALPASEALRMVQLFPGLQLYNEYGPTEVTVGCIVQLYDAQEHQQAAVPIGYALAGNHVLLVSESGRVIKPQPGDNSEAGELWLGGPQMSEGYWHAPELNASKFVMAPAPHQGMYYRSGDQAWYNAAGALVYDGRIDEQVKVGGYRIEPSEIARTLEKLPGIRQAHVLLQESKGQESLLACIRNDSDITYQQLVKHLRISLPYWMIPHNFVRVPYFPVLPSGKVDNAALEQLARKSLLISPIPQSQKTVRPESKAEAILALASQAAGIPVALGDNLIDAGLDSIRLLQLTRQLSDSFDHELPISQVITEPTGEHLLEMLEAPLREQLLFTLQEGSKGTVYCFPAAVGGILPFRQLAPYLHDYTVKAFAFAESEELILHYAEEVQQEAADNSIFIGYSGGGNLAFAVARELDQRAKGPGLVIMLDAFRKSFLPKQMPPAILRMKQEALAVFAEDEQDLFAGELGSYYDFINLHLSDHEGSITAPIYLICSANRHEFGNREVSGRGFFQSWDSATQSHYREYLGAGLHHELMQEPWLAKNAATIQDILKKEVKP